MDSLKNRPQNQSEVSEQCCMFQGDDPSTRRKIEEVLDYMLAEDDDPEEEDDDNDKEAVTQKIEFSVHRMHDFMNS